MRTINNGRLCQTVGQRVAPVQKTALRGVSSTRVGVASAAPKGFSTSAKPSVSGGRVAPIVKLIIGIVT